MSTVDPNPIPIVAHADYDESQLVRAIINATIRDNFAVGRYVLDWHERYSRGRSDLALAELINEANPDADASDDYIRLCRVVAKQFPTRVGNLPWSHHKVAVELDKPNAAAWLAKAEKNDWSKRELEAKIAAQLHPGKIRSHALQHSIDLEYAHFRRYVEGLSDTDKFRAWIKTSPDFLIHNAAFLKDKMVRVKRSVELILNALAGVGRGRSAGKEA